MAKCDTTNLYNFDLEIQREKNVRVVGIDEAGRGPLAGPVVAAAVVLDLCNPISGINDSKKIAPDPRKRLHDEIRIKAVSWAIGEASHEEIDKYNILQATFLAMKRALDNIKAEWTMALVDGNQFIPSIEKSLQTPLVKGDGRSASIAAASIIAKVTRDNIMEHYHRQYPHWDFAKHKGYPTARHRQCIGQFGLCNIHRKTFCTHILGAAYGGN
jgi:ribonuclease HII